MFLFQPPLSELAKCKTWYSIELALPEVGHLPSLKKEPIMKVLVTNAVTNNDPLRNLIRSIYKKSILVSVLFTTSWLFLAPDPNYNLANGNALSTPQ